MTIIHESFIGTPGHPRYVTVFETPMGMNMREDRLGQRIRANELSYAFIVEIAESTIPFRNVHNLMDNIIIRHKWTTENCNLRSVCRQIMKACEKAMDLSKAPATCGNMFPIIRRTPNDDEDVLLEPIVESEAKDCDLVGRGIKRYPHTYECILHPHMVKVYKDQDTYAKQKEWSDRTDRDGSPRVMERRASEAEERWAKVLPF